MTEIGTHEEMAQAAQFLMEAIVRQAVVLVSVEEGDWSLFGCPSHYLGARLELNDRETWPIADAIAYALVQNELATLKKWEMNVWGSRDGWFWSIGEAGVPWEWVALTDKGKAFAANVSTADSIEQEGS